MNDLSGRALPCLRLGRLFVFDRDNGRLTVYSPGDYQLTRMANLATNLPDYVEATDVLAVLPEGLVVQFEYFPSEDTADENDWPMEIKFLDHFGEVLRDSIVLIPSEQRTLIADEIMGNLTFPREYGRESFIISSSDGLIYAGWNVTI